MFPRTAAPEDGTPVDANVVADAAAEVVARRGGLLRWDRFGLLLGPLLLLLLLDPLDVAAAVRFFTGDAEAVEVEAGASAAARGEWTESTGDAGAGEAGAAVETEPGDAAEDAWADSEVIDPGVLGAPTDSAAPAELAPT